MNRTLVRKILYPLHERLRGRSTYRFLKQFKQHDTWSRERLFEHRDHLVADLVRHAQGSVPWWREAAAGIEVNGVADLSRLPTMDKGFIREHLDSLVADGWRDRCFQLATGGSSGEPLIFYTDKERESSQLAAKARAREWWDIRIGDRQVDLWGSPIELGAQDRIRDLKDRLLNFRILSAFKLTDEAMAGYAAFLRDGGTDFLYGYASVLARYARFLEARGENLHDLKMKGAIATAELLLDVDAEVIARVFGCPAINEYGCRDGGWIAQTCPEGGMHIAADCVHVEVLDDDGQPLPPGEVGEITLTNLYSFGMPLIRYRLGDRAALLEGDCPCGRPYPLMGDLQGRRTDTLITPDGNRIHGLGVMYVLRVLPAVAVYQVVQDSVDQLQVLVVPRGEPTEAELESPVLEGLRDLFGEAMKIEVKRVAEIPALASGKMRAIWNRLDG